MQTYDFRKVADSKHPHRRIEVLRNKSWITAMLEEELPDGSVWAKTDHVKKYKPGQWRELAQTKV